MVSTNADVFAVYSDNYMDELFGTMTLLSQTQSVVSAADTMSFLTDVDKIDVPAPAGFAMIALALMGMRIARKSSK